MKLKETFVLRQVGTDHYLISIGDSASQGMSRLNNTAAFIAGLLQQPTTPEQIVQAICAKYQVDARTAAQDVAELLQTFRSYGALEE